MCAETVRPRNKLPTQTSSTSRDIVRKLPRLIYSYRPVDWMRFRPDSKMQNLRKEDRELYASVIMPRLGLGSTWICHTWHGQSARPSSKEPE